MNRLAPGVRSGHAVAGGERLQCAAVSESLKKSLRCDAEHQCVRPDPEVEQMFDCAGVIAEDVAIAHAEPPVVVDDDAAGLEGLRGFFHGLASRRHAEVGANGAQRLDDRNASARSSRSRFVIHGRIAVAKDRRRQGFDELADGEARQLAELERITTGLVVSPIRRAESDART